MTPNVVGGAGGNLAGVQKIFAMVEGAGDVFINNSLKWKIVRAFVCSQYKRSFRYAKKVFFLNEDDKAEFLARKLVQPAQCEIIHGIGVDLERFAYTPIVNDRTFLMVARMLKTKGVLEYCETARRVREKYPDAVFNYLGAEGTVKVSDIQDYIDDGSIRYLGTTNDVRPYYRDCSVNVLPSYREGLGLVNAEAGAIGRPSITCNVIGTRDTVKDGYNGFLVESHSVQALYEKVVWLLENPTEISIMGKNARAFSENKFDAKAINEYLLTVIRSDYGV